jgi:hypothetical protein
MKIGERVQYKAAFLRSTGQLTGALPNARGVVVALKPLGPETTLAEVLWDHDWFHEVPTRVNVANLERRAS